MIEQIYKENLADNLKLAETKDFPYMLKFFRDMMGLKQYACAEYMGIVHSRYKKLEQGKIATKLHDWELKRLELFFKLPKGLLEKKEDSYLARGSVNSVNRSAVGKFVWSQDAKTTG